VAVLDEGEGDANPTHLDLSCDPGDPIVSIAPFEWDPPLATWSDPLAFHEVHAEYPFGRVSGAYSWNGGVGTQVTFTVRAICAH
jgi:hypothetical protein